MLIDCTEHCLCLWNNIVGTENSVANGCQSEVKTCTHLQPGRLVGVDWAHISKKVLWNTMIITIYPHVWVVQEDVCKQRMHASYDIQIYKIYRPYNKDRMLHWHWCALMNYRHPFPTHSHNMLSKTSHSV